MGLRWLREGLLGRRAKAEGATAGRRGENGENFRGRRHGEENIEGGGLREGVGGEKRGKASRERVG